MQAPATSQDMPSRDAQFAPGLMARVGNTPLFRLRHLSRGLPHRVELYVNAEWFNPTGSV